MRRWMVRGVGLVLACVLTSSFAIGGGAPQGPGLNRVIYQVHLKGFATTDTANVTVLVNATVENQDLGKLQQGILQKLKRIGSNQAWHLIDFKRNQDNAGLETLQIRASARLTQAELDNLRARVKAASKTGLKFEVQKIDFQPSSIEYEKERAVLRQKVYELVNAELIRLNKQYPSQAFFVHTIDFLGLSSKPPRQSAMASGASMRTALVSVASQTQSPTVGQAVYMTATVVLSSTVK